jgi:hypothetical protein
MNTWEKAEQLADDIFEMLDELEKEKVKFFMSENAGRGLFYRLGVYRKDSPVDAGLRIDADTSPAYALGMVRHYLAIDPEVLTLQAVIDGAKSFGGVSNG